MPRKKHILICLLLVVSLLASCAEKSETFESLDPFVPEPYERTDVHFSELPYYLPDAGELSALYHTFISDMEVAESAEQQVEMITTFDRELYKYSDMYKIAHIRYSQNVCDDTAADIEYFAQLFADTDRDNVETNKAIINSKFIKQLERYFGERAIGVIRKYVEEHDPRHAELSVQITELQNRYMQLYNDKIENIEYDGEFYTYLEMAEMERNEQDIVKQREIQDAWVASLKYFRTASENICSDLQERRASIAKLAGYDNYAEFYFSDTSLTVTELKTFINNVKRTLAPIFNETDVTEPPYAAVETAEQAYDLSIHVLRSVFEETEPMTDYLERNGFVDYMPGKNRDMRSYMLFLNGTQTPFIFLSDTDPQVFIHEYGHAFEAFMIPAIDFVARFSFYAPSEVTEISSLGMEALASSQFELLYGDMAEQARLHQLYNMTLMLLYSVMNCEFELELYERGLTVSQRDATFNALAREYGISAGMWQSNPHFFSSPLYSINYVFGYLAALELRRVMEDDLPEAKEMYLAYISDSMQSNLAARLESADFSSPFDVKTLEALASYLQTAFESEEYLSIAA